MAAFAGKDKIVLAAIAAHGILAHNSAVELPQSYTEKQIIELSKVGFGEVPYCLERLTANGYLRKRNSGYNGYGGYRVEGEDTWRVSPEGLIALWV